MPKTSGTGRNQRNNPYQLDELFVKFHRTPAGIAWRWRTELLTLSGLAVVFWRLDTWTTAHLGRSHPRRPGRRGPGRAALPPVHHPAVLVRPGPAPAPAAVLRSPAAHPLRAAPAHPVDPADQGRGAHLGAVPRGHLRRGLRSPHRRAARRLLRPRRAGHPQPPVVPPDHHRHHPPRHPRGQRAHRIPPRAPDRALPRSWPSSPTTSTSQPPDPARRSPDSLRGPPALTPRRRHP